MEQIAQKDIVISIDNVSYDYRSNSDEFVARGVKGVSLSIERGDFCVLLGRNGSGKSTLAKLLNGFIVPDSGTVLVNGIDTKTTIEYMISVQRWVWFSKIQTTKW